ncbi:MAG: hypothetical protein HXX19_02780 [Rhodoferax sp.]|nr:hypothetical protein [Rhodoferax sp.]
MRVLFDQGTPVPLRQVLSGHSVATAYELGWSTLKNGDLLRSAEENGFEVLVTTDSNLRYQQNLASRRIAVIVLSTISWPRIRAASARVAAAVGAASTGSYAEVVIP